LYLQRYNGDVEVFGISESFVKDTSKKSVLAGIVMETNMVIKEFVFSTATIGGMDATQKIIKMYNTISQKAVSLLLLNGCIISWYNVVDLKKVVEETELPLICVTYKKSKGLEKYFRDNHPKDSTARIEVYHKNKTRTSMKLNTGHTIYVRFFHLNFREVNTILNKLTIHGAIPEPLRIARLLARSIVKNKYLY
jgi:endonuclease V-like protein UPF0215 family